MEEHRTGRSCRLDKKAVSVRRRAYKNSRQRTAPWRAGTGTRHQCSPLSVEPSGTETSGRTGKRLVQSRNCPEPTGSPCTCSGAGRSSGGSCWHPRPSLCKWGRGLCGQPCPPICRFYLDRKRHASWYVFFYPHTWQQKESFYVHDLVKVLRDVKLLTLHKNTKSLDLEVIK